MPPDPIVKPGIRLVENTDPYADGAVPSVADPELKTLFRVDIPFVDTGIVGDCLSFVGRFAKRYGLPRAPPGALRADRAHLAHA